jgi:hypothetical protein
MKYTLSIKPHRRLLSTPHPSVAARAGNACANPTRAVSSCSETRGHGSPLSTHSRQKRNRLPNKFESFLYRLDPGTCQACATIEKSFLIRWLAQKSAAAVSAGLERQAMRDKGGYKATSHPLLAPAHCVGRNWKNPKFCPPGFFLKLFQGEVAEIRFARRNFALVSRSRKRPCEEIRETGRLLLKTWSRASLSFKPRMWHRASPAPGIPSRRATMVLRQLL